MVSNYQVYKLKSAVALLISGISERTKLPWTHNTFFFMCLTPVNINSAHHQQFRTTTYIFSFVIMSSFLLKKKHMRETLLFCFNLKKSAVESHRMLVEAYGDNALSETTCRDWFRRFNDNNFDLSETRSVKSVQESWGLSIAGSFGRGRYPIAKNACRAIGCFSNSHFHAATCHGEGSKDRKMDAAWTER